VPDFAFVRDPPERVGDLAAALGIGVAEVLAGHSDMGFVVNDRFSATYEWDMYHENPVRSADDLARRTLREYTVFYADGRSACEAALRAVHGAPREVAGRIRYGPFFLSGGDRFNLAWYASEPDWAAPPVDPVARVAEVQALAAAIERAATIEEARAALGGTSLRLHPPMPVADAARALGRPGAEPVAADVHMSHWVIPVQLGSWRVEATVDGDVVRWISLY
jgi:hypothetical protein